MIKIRFQLGDFARIPRALQDFYEDIDDMRPFYKNHFIPRYLEDVNANFESEGGAVGGWAELSPEYAEWKAQRYGNKKINQLTGTLKRAFSPKGRSKLLQLRMERRQVHVSVNLDYAVFVNNERRFMLGFRDLNQKDYMRLLGLWVIEQAKKAGLVKGGPGGR